MSQLDMFAPSPTPAEPDPFGRNELLAHKWYGNRCPACGAPPGQLCKMPKSHWRRPPTYPGAISLHGMRSRFSRPGVYMEPGDDEWPVGGLIHEASIRELQAKRARRQARKAAALDPAPH